MRDVKERPSIEVVAAFIRCGEGKFMIFRRPRWKTRGLQWEFVGGKVEPGETKVAALVRECREEIAVTVEVGRVLAEVVHKYPDISIHLTLFEAKIIGGEPQKLEHEEIRIITREEVSQYNFCPADEELINGISEERI